MITGLEKSAANLQKLFDMIMRGTEKRRLRLNSSLPMGGAGASDAIERAQARALTKLLQRPTVKSIRPLVPGDDAPVQSVGSIIRNITGTGVKRSRNDPVANRMLRLHRLFNSPTDEQLASFRDMKRPVPL